MLGVWASTILTWIRRYAADHSEKPAPSGKAIVLAIDERWHFLKKNGANSGAGRLFIVIQAAVLILKF
jgi:transposase